MARSRVKTQATILDAATGNGVGTSMRVTGYESVLLAVSSASSADGTIKIQGSILGSTYPTVDTGPDFSAAQTTANHWDYVGSYDEESAGFTRGDTGYTMTGTAATDCKILLVNTDGLEWINVIVSGHTTGTITVKAVGFSFE